MQLATWREEYNKTRPHSSLGDWAPTTFAARWLVAAGLSDVQEGVAQYG